MRRYINQIRDNEALKEIYQLTEVQLRSNKNGNLYLQFSISDKTGTLGGRLWNASDEICRKFEVNDYLEVEGTIQRFQGALQLIAKKLTKVPADSVDPGEFERFRPIDVDRLRQRVREILRTLRNTDLMNLCDCILLDEELMTQFCRMPAGIRLHHAYPGGLLEHTCAMMEVVLAVAPFYPMLDRDILLVGAFLHDIGKTREFGEEGDFVYSGKGQMLGHPFLGVEILEEKIEEAEKLSGQHFDDELEMILKHLLISHHGTLKNGACKVPMTLEALALHFIDSFDAKIAEFQKHIFEDPCIGSPWTNYIPQIERKLYKGKDKQ